MKTHPCRPARFSALLLSIAVAVTGSLLFSPASTLAQGGVPLWTNRYNGSADSEDYSRAVGVDRNGNVLVTGESVGEGTYVDFATVKYSAGGLALWTNRHDSYLDRPIAIAVDTNGDVFVTGSSSAAGIGGNLDYGTLKYSSNGDLLWLTFYNSPFDGPDLPRAMVLDSAQNVIVTGESVNPIANSTEYETIKYSRNGNELWAVRSARVDNGGYGNAPVSLAVDSVGNVFVVGHTRNGNVYSFLILKYSDEGIPLWTNHYRGLAGTEDHAYAAKVDAAGNVLVTGYSAGDYATLAYSGSGVPLWTNRYNSAGDGIDIPAAIAVDRNGNVFVTGVSGLNGNIGDFLTLKYSGSGVPLWTNRFSNGTYSANVPRAVALDNDGNVFITGGSFNGTNWVAATVAYSNAGLPLWTNCSNADGTDCEMNAIALDNRDNVIVTGYATSTSHGADFVTIKYSAVPPHLDFGMLNNQLVLSWTNTDFSLQSAPGFSEPFTNVPSATSPYTNSLASPQQFFRLISN